ncbi:hypothetical protein INQ51_09795 [Maribellus sp. CM-23]|uniref:hypothetical protein n=1 Tax=Maribellus sp. CM-23 TaxID=2781026 RepID=UPI001F4749FA|nr:hypothetical protein [Maribellus sp. CM-23]MCE4564601.1 hypothetical protein [Maribellus sp. CM-23]
MKCSFILLSLICFSILTSAETPVGHESKIANNLLIPLNDSGSAYSKLSFATQFWARQTQLNPGSTTISGDPIASEFDFALRRTRFSMFNKLNKKTTFYTQFGFNNLNASSSKPTIYFHDVWAMYDLLPKSLSLGFGLNGWNGISRLTNASYQKTLTLDNPGFNIPSVNHSDLEIRQFGIFIKGTLNRLNYRAVVSKPMVYNGVPEQPDAEKGYEFPSTQLAWKAYTTWNFWEREYFQTPYVPMTYFGEKKICNLGVGFDFYPGSVAEFDNSGDRTLKDRMLLGADYFMELPFKNNQAISVYSVIYNYNFGTNYLRTSGTMNRWYEGTAAEGAGNAEYKIGTGNIWYSTLGYLLPRSFMEKAGRLQLFCAYALKDFEALPQKIYNYDFGANLFANGHKLKFSMQYSFRPLAKNVEAGVPSQHLGTFIFQTQIVI